MLQLTQGRSAKAFFRRGLAFEQMEDLLNAYHDFSTLSAAACIASPAEFSVLLIDSNCHQYLCSFHFVSTGVILTACFEAVSFGL